MSWKIQLATTAVFLVAFLFLTALPTQASEGTAELRSAVGQQSRCFVSSILTRDFNYSLIVSCRELIYPPASDMFAYVLWATSLKDDKPARLGELGVGRAEFRTDFAFSNLFVTKERDSDVRSPSELVIMQGNMQPINFLEGPAQPLPESQEKEGVTVTPTPTKTPPAGGIVAGIRRVIITFFVILFAVVIVAIALISTFRRLRG